MDDLEACKLKIHLTIKMNFVSTTGCAEYCQIHSTSDNLEIMNCFNTDKTIEKLFESIL